MNGIEILPADPEGWWCMEMGNENPDEWFFGETPQEALNNFLDECPS